jgi:site-specific recombinase XerD
VYKGALSMIKRFTGGDDIKFYQIDKGFLLEYREFLSEKRYKPNYISLNLRTFQSVYNHAKDHGYVKGDSPFEHKAIMKGVRKNKTSKRAISMEDVVRIFNLEFEPGTRLFHARNYFVFGFLGDGINFVDMAHLRWTNIVDGRIEYVRHKKKSTKPESTSFKITPEIKQILSYYRPQSGIDPDNYIFPVFHKHVHITPQQLDNRKHKVLAQVNDDLKTIGKKARIRTKLTTYVWRHSVATQLIIDGASLEDVRLKMNHESIGTTETYIKDLQIQKRDKYSDGLSDKLTQSKKASS